MATAPTMPLPKAMSDKEKTVIPMSEQLPPAGARKTYRRRHKRGGFRTQDVNTSAPVPATGPQGPLGGRRRKSRKHRKSRRHH